LGERRRDAAVSAYFTELARLAVLSSGSLANGMETLLSRRGASARSNQKRASVWLIHGGVLRNSRSAGEASALFSVGKLVQNIQKKIASENAKREKYCG
jgi:hypothetical protein